jgi:branched-chain amino acid transport system ATP-binding protein
MLAATILADRQVVLLDEPLAGLNVAVAERLVEILKRLAAEKPVIVVDHEAKSLAAKSDRIVGLRAGEVVLDSAGNDVTAAGIEQVYAP